MNELKNIYIDIFRIIEFDYRGDYSEEDMSRKLEAQKIKYICSESEAEINAIISSLIHELKNKENIDQDRVDHLVAELRDIYNYSKYSD